MMRSTEWQSRLQTTLICLLWLGLWQVLHLFVGSTLLLPSPFEVFQRIFSFLGRWEFYATVLHSFSRIFMGYLLGVICGTIIAVATAFSPFAKRFFVLPMNVIKATPVASFVILALVWISGKNLSVFISFLMVMPLVWSNVHAGISSADKSLLQMASLYRLTSTKKLLHIYVPAALPYFVSAATVSLGFAWKSGIAGEVIAIPNGAIGTQLYNAKIYLDSVDLFAWTAIIILLSVLLEHGILRLLPKILKE